jgi:hypothetical protein
MFSPQPEAFIVITQQDLYWILSTIAQTLGAIVGIVGMVTVYQFQNIRNSNRDLIQNSFNNRIHVFGIDAIQQDAYRFLVEFQKKYPDIKKALEGRTPGSERHQLYGIYKDIKSHFHKLTIFRKVFLLFIVSHLLAIFFSILSIQLADELIKIPNFNFIFIFLSSAILVWLFFITFLMLTALLSEQRLPLDRLSSLVTMIWKKSV